MKKRKTWILIADGARARIVENDGPGKGIAPALNYEFATSHAPTRDIGTDKPGRRQGGGAHHAVDPKVNWHNFEKSLFAAAMAEVLEKANNENIFDALVLVAPAKTLGELRKKLSPKVKNKITGELGKDLTHIDMNDLGKHLSEVINI
ncbi:MAG: host attachment protein [Rhodospirillaceae bacterium]|nr:host attachment protein [Rhodospirillaceae bacterium]